MLEAKTEKQLRHIATFMGCELEEWTVGAYPIRTLQMEEPISFDTMEKIVDYLRKENEEVEIPKGCSVSADSYGVVYDLRDTPHEEVMQFCKRLAWVKGGSFDHYYEQYVKTGKIRL